MRYGALQLHARRKEMLNCLRNSFGVQLSGVYSHGPQRITPTANPHTTVKITCTTPGALVFYETELCHLTICPAGLIVEDSGNSH